MVGVVPPRYHRKRKSIKEKVDTDGGLVVIGAREREGGGFLYHQYHHRVTVAAKTKTQTVHTYIDTPTHTPGRRRNEPNHCGDKEGKPLSRNHRGTHHHSFSSARAAKPAHDGCTSMWRMSVLNTHFVVHACVCRAGAFKAGERERVSGNTTSKTGI